MKTPDRARKRLGRIPPPSFNDKLRRLGWGIVQATLYRWSPVAFHGFRCSLLRCFGAKISTGVHVYPSTIIWAPWNLAMESGSCLGPSVNCYSVSCINIGAHAIVSQGVHLCAATHDFRDRSFPLLIGSIELGSRAWIAADAFVGPGVAIGARSVIGARAVVTRDVDSDSIVVGNPSRVIGHREDDDSTGAGGS